MIALGRLRSRALPFAFAFYAGSFVACAGTRLQMSGEENPAQQWTSDLAMTRRAAADGRFDVADSILVDYATQHAGSVDALETAYWRAMLKMDPGNPHPSLVSAMALLDGYLADVRPHEHAVEAATLRRLAAQLDVLNRLTANMAVASRGAVETGSQGKLPGSVTSPSATDQAANDAEVKRLKDELAKANAELDRIRKRLSTPPPP